MTYSLPVISTIHGDFNIDIIAPDWTLTTPTIQTVKGIGRFRKSAFITVSEQEIGTLKISLMDDYTNHTEGFWHKMFASSTYVNGALYDIEFRITLTEGGTEKYFFFGSPQSKKVNWKTHYYGTNRIRTCEITLLESISKIFELSVTDWVDEVSANAVTTDVIPAEGDGVYKAISIRGLFSAMLSASLTPMNPSYDRDDTTFVYGTQDLKFKEATTNYNLGQVYVATEIADSGAPVVMEYYDSDSGGCLDVYYSSLKQLLGDMIKNFGVVLTFSYDLDTDRYLFELRQCWRAYSTTLSFGTDLDAEDATRSSDLVLDAARATQLKDAAVFAWFSHKYTSLAKNETAPPDYVSFDFDGVNIFNIVSESPNITGRVLYGKASELETGGVPPVALDAGEWYSYFLQEYQAEAPVLASSVLEVMIAGYYSNRFAVDWRKVDASYGGITASEDGGGATFSVVDLLKRISINDGHSARVFFANTVEIDIDADETTIEWIQEAA